MRWLQELMTSFVYWIERKMLYHRSLGWRKWLLIGIAVFLMSWLTFALLNRHYQWIKPTIQTTIIDDETIGSLWDGEATISRSMRAFEITPTPTMIPEPTMTPTPTITPEPTAAPKRIDEYDLFCRIIALEGDPRVSDPYDLYLRVATVIMNRVDSDLYPDTIAGVIKQKGQFTTYLSTRKPVYNDAVYKAADDALSGVRNLPSDIIGFMTKSAYKRLQSRGGWIRNCKVYDTEYGCVWLYVD